MTTTRTKRNRSQAEQPVDGSSTMTIEERSRERSNEPSWVRFPRNLFLVTAGAKALRPPPFRNARSNGRKGGAGKSLDRGAFGRCRRDRRRAAFAVLSIAGLVDEC